MTRDARRSPSRPYALVLESESEVLCLRTMYAIFTWYFFLKLCLFRRSTFWVGRKRNIAPKSVRCALCCWLHIVKPFRPCCPNGSSYPTKSVQYIQPVVCRCDCDANWMLTACCCWCETEKTKTIASESRVPAYRVRKHSEAGRTRK